MTDNVIYTSSSYSVNRDNLNDSTRRKLRNNLTNGEINGDKSSPQEEKQCNRFGFFVGSHEAEVLP